MGKSARRSLLLLVLVVLLQLFAGEATVLADPGYHIVRAGDTLYSIGRLYGVNPYAISAANSLSNPNYIYIGQVLYIPWGSSAPAPAQPQYSYPPNYWWYPSSYPYSQNYWWYYRYWYNYRYSHSQWNWPYWAP